MTNFFSSFFIFILPYFNSYFQKFNILLISFSFSFKLLLQIEIMLLTLISYIIQLLISMVAPSVDYFSSTVTFSVPLYLSYTDTTYAWFSFLCVPSLHSTNLNIHFTLYYVSWRV